VWVPTLAWVRVGASVSSVLTFAPCGDAGIYPFANTDIGLMFVFLVFWAISLIMFCYFLSTLFSRYVPLCELQLAACVASRDSIVGGRGSSELGQGERENVIMREGGLQIQPVL
jgi:hypothetical protein